jgi:hypothetical protein
MAKPGLSIVSNADKGTEFEPDDPVFFSKRSVRLNTKIAHCGRLDPQSVWHVVKIESYTKLPSGKYSLKKVSSVQHLTDLVYLERYSGRAGRPDTRRASFGTLSYSAIWRLAE